MRAAVDEGSLEALAAFAHSLADAARRDIQGAWAGGCSTEDKGEGAFDPVTEADRAAERAMRRLIEERFPDHGISGEEYPDRRAAGRYRWSLDPIDGTRAFVCGLPTWVTLIALLEDNAPVLGVIDAPRLGERYIGYGETAKLIDAGGEGRLATSGCRHVAEARLSTTDPYFFAEPAEAFARLRSAVRLTRYGLDGYGYARLAAGGLDIVAESGLKPHDYNALIPVVRGAGGVIGNWKGEPDLREGQVLAAATPQLFDEAVALLGI